MSFLVGICFVLLLILTVPVAFFCIEIFVGLCSDKREKALELNTISSDLSSVILIPAHNEALVIEKTLNQLRQEVSASLDSILVIADNCDDDTASLSRSLGVDVIERFDSHKRGKGFALQFAIDHLHSKERQPDVIIIFDADCRFAEGSLKQLKAICFSTNRPVQSAYRLLAPEGASITARIAEFAIRVKNIIRNRGLVFLGYPAVLTGTGMAFPYKALQQVNLASSELAEDMKLGVDMTLSGFPAAYTDQSEVLSELPLANDATSSQRERWEHGHLTVMKTYLPQLLFKVLKEKNTKLLGTFLDLTIPPLSLLVMIALVVGCFISVIGIISQAYMLVVYSSVLLISLGLSVLSAWWHQGRDLLSVQDLLMLPIFILSKIGVYRKFVSGPQTAWVRTKRDGEDKSS